MNIEDLRQSALEQQTKSATYSRCVMNFEEVAKSLGITRAYAEGLIKSNTLETPYQKGIMLRPSDVVLLLLRMPEDLFQSSKEALTKDSTNFQILVKYYNLYKTLSDDVDLLTRALLRLHERFSFLAELADKTSDSSSEFNKDIKEATEVLSSIITRE